MDSSQQWMPLPRDSGPWLVGPFLFQPPSFDGQGRGTYTERTACVAEVVAVAAVVVAAALDLPWKALDSHHCAPPRMVGEMGPPLRSISWATWRQRRLDGVFVCVFVSLYVFRLCLGRLRMNIMRVWKLEGSGRWMSHAARSFVNYPRLDNRPTRSAFKCQYVYYF